MVIGVSGGSKNTATMTDNFYGLNRTRHTSNGEMEDMKNMSSDEFPCASPRCNRNEIVNTENEILAVTAPISAFTEDVTGFTGVMGNGFYYNGVRKTAIKTYDGLSTHETELPANCQWEIERKGDMYILNGYNPDTKRSQIFYYDTETDVFGYGGKVMPKMIIMAGNDSKGDYIEALLDCGDVKNYVINYSDGTTFNCGDYFEIYHEGAGQIDFQKNVFTKYFSAGDDIRIEGFRDKNEGQFFEISNDKIVPDTGQKDFTSYNTFDMDDIALKTDAPPGAITSIKVKSFSTVKGENYRHKMYVTAYNVNGSACNLFSLGSDSFPIYYAGVTLSKKMPTLNHIAVHQGRLWGSSPSGRYIYASASDSIFSFSYEDMTNKFAWRMPTDAVGPVTGFSSYNDEFVVFKEDAMSIITGYGPKNYQINTLSGIGCIAPKSCQVTSKGVIFLAYDGFYIYNGSYPKIFSHSLNRKYTDAVSGFDGRKYYVSVTDSEGNREVLVYDTLYGLWHREDEFMPKGYFRFRDGFYVCDSNTLYKLGTDQSNVPWSMTLAQRSGLDLKGINEIWLRCEIDEGAEFTVYTDIGKGGWRKHVTFTEADGVTVYRVPVRFINTDNYRVKITGRGKVVIYAIELIASEGGRRHKERL